MSSAPPQIFAPARRLAVRRVRCACKRSPARRAICWMTWWRTCWNGYAFLRHQPTRSLVIGDWSGALAAALGGDVMAAEPAEGFAEEQPFPDTGFDFIASLGTLDTVNDLPGALIHLRSALAPGGLVLASFIGAGSLPALRAAMLEADGDRPAPRLHPMVDVRAGGQLLQRAGWADPVVDSRTLSVRYTGLDRLVGDLRAQGLSNVLARPGPTLTRTQAAKARAAFGAGTVERFEILTLSGWKR